MDKFFKNTFFLLRASTYRFNFRFNLNPNSSDMKQIGGKLGEDAAISSIKKTQQKITKKNQLNSAAVLVDVLLSHVHCKYLETENINECC